MYTTKARQFGRRSFLSTTASSALVISGVNVPGFGIAQASTSSEPAAQGPLSLEFDLVLSDQSWALGTGVHDLLHGQFQPRLVDRSPSSKPLLLVLPMAETESSNIRMEEPFEALSRFAQTFSIYLAGAAPMIESGGADPRQTGFLIAPSGAVLLTTHKITPDLGDGFSDLAATIGAPGSWPVARTPLGNIGVLVGEDVLMAQHLSPCVTNGVEILLNPAKFGREGGLNPPDEVLLGCAYSQRMVVASTSAISSHGVPLNVEASGLYGADGFVDIQAQPVKGGRLAMTVQPIRQLRTQITENFPVIMRSELFSKIFSHDKQVRHEEAFRTRGLNSRAAWRDEAIHRVAALANSPEPLLANVIGPYDAIVAQTDRIDPGGPRDVAYLERNMEHVLALAEPEASDEAVRLVVFAEFAFTASGFRTVQDLYAVAVEFPGPQIDRLGEFAQKNNVYVAGQMYEKDKRFPGRIFNSAFIISDSGDLIHHRHKMQCSEVFGLPDTTPGSIFDKYIDTFGYDRFFPVADTPIGKLANFICIEGAYLEVASSLSAQGAEILCNPTAEGSFNVRRAWHGMRRATAYQSQSYLLTANPANNPDWSTRFRSVGGTCAIDYDGNTLGKVEHGERAMLRATIDVSAVRRSRQDVQRNLVVWNDPAVYADQYSHDLGLRNNLWLNSDVNHSPLADESVREGCLQAFFDAGVYVKPKQLT